jgi:hypothetical protein
MVLGDSDKLEEPVHLDLLKLLDSNRRKKPFEFRGSSRVSAAGQQRLIFAIGQ